MTAVRNLFWTLLAVATLHGVATAGASESVVNGPGSGLSSPAGAAHSANLLYTDPSVFLRGDLAVSTDAYGQEWTQASGGRVLDAQDVGGRAPVFWLPDSMETGWLARDKKFHSLACYSVVLTGEVVTDELDAGVAWAAGLSIAKELWDLWFKTPASQRGVSMGDLVADAVGTVAAVIALEAFGD